MTGATYYLQLCQQFKQKQHQQKHYHCFFLGYERNYWKFFITWKIEVHKINKFRRTSDVKKKVVWNHLNLCEILRFGKFVLNKYRSENDDKKMFSRNFEISLVESHYYFILFFLNQNLATRNRNIRVKWMS